MKIKAEDNQTLLDIAMQYYANIEAVGLLLELNPGLKNDPVEIVRAGYSDLDSFYLDLKLADGLEIIIDESSRLIDKNAVKKITQPVTTYEHVTND